MIKDGYKYVKEWKYEDEDDKGWSWTDMYYFKMGNEFRIEVTELL